METTLRVVADDLTGAADAAVPFARAARVRLQLDGAQQWADLTGRPFVSRDLDLRQRWGREPDDSLADAFTDVASADVLYLKIDSLLRGPVADYVAAARRALPDHLVVVAPAFPALGRTTRDGLQLLNGREVAAPVRDVPHDRLVDLPSLRGDARKVLRDLADAGVVLADALTDADLDLLVAACLRLDRPVLWVGAGGLARAVARQLLGDEVAVPVRVGETGTRLAVVGSGTASSIRQVQVAAAAGLAHLQLDLQGLASPGGRRAAKERVMRALGAGRALVSLDQKPSMLSRSAASEVLAATLDEPIRSVDHLFITGGSTARACLLHADIRDVAIEGETEPGVVVSSVTEPGGPRTVTTKSGGFGHDRTVLRFLNP